jgi:8-oxo-dGTP pyrophosphatase MutT (NUDIX family)
MTKAAAASSGAASQSGLKLAFGGVVIRADGRVLLREPSNHFDGYVWTFAKGRPNEGESSEETAVREVVEEMGVVGRIISPIAGDFIGGTTCNRYYLMEEDEAGAPLLPHDRETWAVGWATFEEAKSLIGKTINLNGRIRDLAVLESGFAEWKRHVKSH